jgi:O-antigen ligase
VVNPAYQAAASTAEAGPPAPPPSPEGNRSGNRFTTKGLILFLVGILIPIGAYILLPLLGIHTFSQNLGFKKLLLLFGGIIGLVGYLYYLQLVMPRPQLLVGFTIIAWPPVAYLNQILLDQIGINIHFRPLLFLAVSAPSLWVSLKNGGLLLRTIPWLKYYLIFFLWLLLYALFYNANATDHRGGGDESTFSEGSMSIMQLSAYFYCLLSITLPAVTILKARNYKAIFDMLNKGLLVVSSLEALLTIAGYPFGMFNMLLDGFTRAIGLFTHPNPFAHHMGILMVYLMGLFCYYQGERKARMSGALLFSGIALNFVAFLLGLSKTALGVFALCMLLLFLMNLAVPAVRKGFFQILIALAILLPIGLFGFQALSGHNFLDLLESRIDQTQSLNWRTEIWLNLLADVDATSALLGHGFTAANAAVFRMSFNDLKNAHPLMMVHNAYINLIYDLGIMGYLMFVAALSTLFQAARQWVAAAGTIWRTEHSIIIALTVYFLCVCGFDEMSYMFDAPILFWTLVSLVYCMQWRDVQAAKLRQQPAERLPAA